MKARLDTKLELWEISVFAELAVWEKRPDLKIICVAASDHGHCLDKDVVSECLPGLSDRACRNLLRHLEYIGLIDNIGKLTVLGQQCALSGTAPSWEEGVYHLLVTKHPLLGSHILEFKRVAGNGQDNNFVDLEALPPWLRIDKHQKFISALEPSRFFSIAAFPSAKGQNPMCRLRELNPCTLTWEIDLVTGSNQWFIEGHVGATQSIGFKLPPQSVDPLELVNLYPSWEPRWDTNRKILAMAYDGVAKNLGQDNFLRSFNYKNRDVGRFGKFENILVSDIPVGPATDNNARSWAAALFVSRLDAADDYISSKRWSSEWSSVVKGTPLESGAGGPPDAREFLNLVNKPLSARNHWLFFATLDIGMEV